MAEQITTMVAKVDLQCSKCYKKVKKVLSKFPEIRDQVYDVKQNTVTIKVMSCCPEKIKQKIRCKGGKSIEAIEIKPPEKQEKKEPEAAEKKKEPEAAEKKESEAAEKKESEAVEKKKDPGPAEEKKEPEKKSSPPPKTTPEPAVLVYPPITVYPTPIGVCCWECYEGRGGGPCQQSVYGRPVYYDGYYGRPVYDSWGGGGGGGCDIM